MAKSSCKCKKAECEECPEWIFTFADLVMLMMGFFVILWVLKPPAGKDSSSPQSQAEETKWLETVGKIRESFGYIPNASSADPVDQLMLHKDEQPEMKTPGKGGETKTRREGAVGTDPEVTSIRNGLQATVGGRLIFDLNDTRLPPDSAHALDEVANLIRGHYNIVLVKGHTSLDDFPDGTPPEKKMDLSIRRAQAVADYLTQHGVDPAILRVQGCSTFEPVVQRIYTPDAQTQNRRVEIEATSTLVDERQNPRKQSKASDPLPAREKTARQSSETPNGKEERTETTNQQPAGTDVAAAHPESHVDAAH